MATFTLSSLQAHISTLVDTIDLNHDLLDHPMLAHAVLNINDATFVIYHDRIVTHYAGAAIDINDAEFMWVKDFNITLHITVEDGNDVSEDCGDAYTMNSLYVFTMDNLQIDEMSFDYDIDNLEDLDRIVDLIESSEPVGYERSYI